MLTLSDLTELEFELGRYPLCTDVPLDLYYHCECIGIFFLILLILGAVPLFSGSQFDDV